MFEQKVRGFLYLDYETLTYLESLNLSYKEMIPYFDIIVTKYDLSRGFKKHGIKHKTAVERLYEIVRTGDLSISQLCKQYDVSKSTICRIKRKIRQEL